MRIFYFDTSDGGPQGAHFLEVLQELQRANRVDFHFFDEHRFIHHRAIPIRVFERLRRSPVGGSALNAALLAEAQAFDPHLILIGKGSWIEPSTLRELKQRTQATLVNWMTDDPFNPFASTPQILASVPCFDLYVCSAHAPVMELKHQGCGRVLHMMCGYKPSIHFPECARTLEEKRRFQSDVAFIGGADAERAVSILRLVRLLPNLNLHLYGPYWNRYPQLRKYWRGHVTGRDFRLALSGTRIALNLVRSANRDDNNMRTFEVPACGGFMLANRTASHLELLQEDREAAFFSSPEEMADKVSHYLLNHRQRREVARAGNEKIVTRGHSWADRLRTILDAARNVPIRPAAKASRDAAFA
jgi:hypothetical protein